ncbi:ROK family protein [Actinoplanes sp. NPDC049596]|uniref:ROK family protein n=1 Tax=unclassified Actinoplanes TaxID=2626549 RepID=UPI0034361261
MFTEVDAVEPAVTAVFAAVLTGGPISRVTLARHLGISSGAVTKAARPLIEMGYLSELAATERTGPGAGRPASPLTIRADREFFVGVKIAGDELIGVVCDLRAQIHAWTHRRLFETSVDHVLTQLAELVGELLDGAGGYRSRTRRLGLAVSGDVDPATGLVRYSPFLRWHDVPLRERAEEITGLTVTVENDVKALTVAEHWFGEGVGAESFALVTVGAGIGCGLVVGGRLVSGARGVAGEIGHISVDVNGPECHCGSSGCVEAIAGTDAIVRQAREATGRSELTFDDAVALARAGDDASGAVSVQAAAVRAVFARAGEAIGSGIAAVANLVGPSRIVVASESSEVPGLMEAHLRRGFQRQAFGAAADCALSIRPLPYTEWARGAASVSIKALVTSRLISA